MPKPKRRHQNMPLMETGIVHKPIFNYLSLVERHKWGSSRFSHPRTSYVPGESRIQEDPKTRDLFIGAQECWIGQCAGCGKTLISATWRTTNLNAHKTVYCTRACEISSTGASRST